MTIEGITRKSQLQGKSNWLTPLEQRKEKEHWTLTSKRKGGRGQCLQSPLLPAWRSDREEPSSDPSAISPSTRGLSPDASQYLFSSGPALTQTDPWVRLPRENLFIIQIKRRQRWVLFTATHTEDLRRVTLKKHADAIMRQTCWKAERKILW